MEHPFVQNETPHDGERALDAIKAMRADVLKAYEGKRLLKQALSFAKQVTDPHDRSQLFSSLASAATQAGQDPKPLLSEALSFAKQVKSPYLRSQAFSSLASAAAKTGEDPKAFLSEAFSSAEQVTHPYDRFQAFSSLASAAAKTGEDPKVSLSKALSSAEQVTHPYDRSQAFSSLASAAAQAGQDPKPFFSEALSSAEQVTDPYYRSIAFSSLASAAAKAGKDPKPFFSEALSFAKQVTHPYSRSQAFSSLASALCASGASILSSIPKDHLKTISSSKNAWLQGLTTAPPQLTSLLQALGSFLTKEDLERWKGMLPKRTYDALYLGYLKVTPPQSLPVASYGTGPSTSLGTGLEEEGVSPPPDLPSLLSSLAKERQDPTHFRIALETLQELMDKGEGGDTDSTRRLLSSLSDEARKNPRFLSRIIKTLAEIKGDDASHGMALRLAGLSIVPDRILLYAINKLSLIGYLPKEIVQKANLGDRENLSFFRNILNDHEKPSEAKNILEIVSSWQGGDIYDEETKTSKHAKTLSLKDHGDLLLEAIGSLGSVTPKVLGRFLSKDKEGRKELASSIASLKASFFKNIPIQDLLGEEDQDLLSEYVHLCFRPIGMSYEDVRGFIENKGLEDHTDHLDPFTFDQEGYVISLGERKEILLKEGETLNKENILLLASLAEPSPVRHGQTKEEKERGKPSPKYLRINQLLLSLAKGSSDMPQRKEEGKGNAKLVASSSFFHAAQDLLSILKDEEHKKTAQGGVPEGFEQFRQSYGREGSHPLSGRSSLEETHHALGSLFELLGVYRKDNFEQALLRYLETRPRLVEDLKRVLEKKDGMQTPPLPLLEEEGVSPPRRGGERGGVKHLASLLSDLFEKTIIGKKIRPILQREIGRFNVRQETPQTSPQPSSLKEEGAFKAMFSKNIGSFFAKASAGICTAQDIPLWDREDHFHMNLIDAKENKVVGNVQLYLMPDPKNAEKKALLVRGINPSEYFLQRSKADPFFLVQEVMRIATIFAKDNDLAGPYLSEGLGSWHADSNRSGVRKAMERLKKGMEEVAFPRKFPITAGQGVGRGWRIKSPAVLYG